MPSPLNITSNDIRRIAVNLASVTVYFTAFLLFTLINFKEFKMVFPDLYMAHNFIHHGRRACESHYFVDLNKISVRTKLQRIQWKVDLPQSESRFYTL